MNISEVKNKKLFYTLILIGIIAFGLFLRTFNIENTPPGIYPDEAINGEDAIRALQTNNFQWFYQYNTGREGLFMNLIAICFKLFGASILTLKLPAIIFGTLTIWGTYLLTKELFNKERIALISAFLVAASFWSINFSRISFRANMLPFILVFSFYFFFRGIRTKKWLDFAISGFIFGIGMHTYIAWRIAPIVIVLMIIFFILSRKNFLKEHLRLLFVFLLFSVISAFPMFLTFYQHPEYLDARESVSILSPSVNKGHLVSTFLRSFSLSLIKYNFVGDMNWRHNFPPYPILDPLTGLAFLFGIIYSIKIFLQILYSRIRNKVLDINLEKYIFLILWFFLLLAPEFMTAEGNPHALRAIGTLPVVMIFSALGFEFVLNKLKRYSIFKQKLTMSLMIISLIFIGLFNPIKYHFFWANKERVGFSFNKNLTDISKYIQTLPKQEEKIVITSGSNTLERLPIWLMNLPNNVGFFNPNELNKIAPKDPNNLIVFLIDNNQTAIQEIQNRFPNLKLEKVSGTLGSVYYVLK